MLLQATELVLLHTVCTATPGCCGLALAEHHILCSNSLQSSTSWKQCKCIEAHHATRYVAPQEWRHPALLPTSGAQWQLPRSRLHAVLCTGSRPALAGARRCAAHASPGRPCRRRRRRRLLALTPLLIAVRLCLGSLLLKCCAQASQRLVHSRQLFLGDSALLQQLLLPLPHLSSHALVLSADQLARHLGLLLSGTGAQHLQPRLLPLMQHKLQQAPVLTASQLQPVPLLSHLALQAVQQLGSLLRPLAALGTRAVATGERGRWLQ